ncbi:MULTISPECIES: hypothetical protein [Streptomyces]|uniref:hypothetical protein n=1 Tax=Streptomyces TaxID=1883 RepID=UPI003696E02A
MYATMYPRRVDRVVLDGVIGAVLATVDAVQAAAVRIPLRLGSYRVDEHIVPVFLFNGLSQDNPAAFGDLAQAVRDLRRAAEGRAVTPTPWPAESLKFLLTATTPPTGARRPRSRAETFRRPATRRPTGATCAAPAPGTACPPP